MNIPKTTPCPTCKAPCVTTVNMRGGDYGWGTSDAERTVYQYSAPTVQLEYMTDSNKEKVIRDILSKTWQPLYSDFGAVRGYIVHPSHVELLIQKLTEETK